MKPQISRSPSYLVRTPYTYCFRMFVPKDLQRYVGKKELRYSLKTGYLGPAKQKARYLAGQVQSIFRILRKGGIMANLSDDQVKELVNKYIRQSLERINNLFNDEPEEEFPPYTTESGFYSYLSELDGIKQDLIANLNMGNFAMLEYEIRNLLKNQGIKNIDKTSVEYRRLYADIFQAEIKLLPIEKKHRQNDFSYKDELPEIVPRVFPKLPEEREPIPAPDPPKEKPSKLLETIIDEYSKENESAGNWSERTIIEYQSIFRNILRLIGNVQSRDVSHQNVIDFKQALMGMPKDYFKATKKYKNISLKKLLRGKPEETLTTKTINKYITNLSAIFNFAVRHGYMETNFASGIKIRLKGDQRDERDPFNNEDLTALFHSKEYTEDIFKKPWHFWLPILGLYTGCRREELCQLHLKDIKPVDGIWILDIKKDLESGQKTKTKSSNRSMPLHPFITEELNFIGYINQQKEKGETRLFPEFRRQSGRYGHYFGRWFKEYKENCGIISEPGKKVFHSFRHNLQDNLKQNRVLPEIIDELVGHVHQGQTLKRYTKQYKVQILYEDGILKLNYGLDLSHLKNSKFVVK